MKRRHPLARYDEPNPMKPSTETYVIAGVGVVLVGALGYWLYTQNQSNASASSSGGGGTVSGGGSSTSYTNISGTNNPPASPPSTDTTNSGDSTDFWSAGQPGGSVVSWATDGLAQPSGSPLG